MKFAKTIIKTAALGLFAGGLVLSGVGSGALSAQEVDNRWLPWIGCWEASAAETESPMLCVTPLRSGDGVELATWSEGEIISTETIHTDGVARDASREGCQGTQEASFSHEGTRVYLKSEYWCEGGVQRGGTGLLAFANPVEWLDVKVVEVAGRKVPMVLRYRPARAARVQEVGLTERFTDRAMAIRTARMAASVPLTADDIIEAGSRVDSEAVEALVAERGDAFDVNADLLVELAEAGVPENLIDLTVAVSFPEKFTVAAGVPEAIEREGRPRSAFPYYGSYGRRSWWGFWDPFFSDPMYYSFYSPWRYSSFGGGWYYPGYYRPTTIIVDSNPGSANQHGRVVKGRGYTRGGAGSSGSARPSARSGASGSSGAVRSSGSPSRGSSGKSTGRTAKRRGGGGDLF